MSRIRVLRVITRLNIGGPAINAALLSTRLDPGRFESLLVAGSESPSEGSMLELGRLGEGLALKRVAALGREISPVDDLRALAAVTRIAREFRPQIVHTHLAKAGTVGRVAARLAGARAVIHTYHGTVFRGYFGGVKSRAVLEVERSLSRITTRIVAITPGQRRELIELGIGNERKVVEIPLGFDLAPFLDAPEQNAARDGLRLPHGVPIVAIVARLVPVKDVGMFLRVMAKVPAPALAVVVGDGELRTSLEGEAAALGLDGRCRFLGWQRDVASVYAAADVVALTSRNEGSPVSIIEAMAAARAVVCTAVGGVPEVVGPSTGILVPYGDVTAFAAAVSALLSDPERRLQLGSSARRAIHPAYDASRLVADTERLYESVL
jgi:glycosyltransferase involved in cell wall biosynthesis